MLLLTYSLSSFIIFIAVFTLILLNNQSNNKYLKEYLINIISNVTILHRINPTAGLANNLRGISSTLLLSYFSDKRFYLSGWMSISLYFNFPQQLIMKSSITRNITFQTFNKRIIELLEQKNSTYVKVTDIHGYQSFLLNYYKDSMKLNILKKLYSLKYVNVYTVSNIIYKEFFNPSAIINHFVNEFNKKKGNKKILGVHIRSGHFNNINYTETYFKKIIIDKYIKNISMYLKFYNISYIYKISDNECYLHLLKNIHCKTIHIPLKGSITHSKFSLYKRHINDNAIRIVAEFILLSNCEIIIGTKMSSFSEESCKYKKKMKCLFI